MDPSPALPQGEGVVTTGKKSVPAITNHEV